MRTYSLVVVPMHMHMHVVGCERCAVHMMSTPYAMRARGPPKKTAPTPRISPPPLGAGGQARIRDIRGTDQGYPRHGSGISEARMSIVSVAPLCRGGLVTGRIGRRAVSKQRSSARTQGEAPLVSQ